MPTLSDTVLIGTLDSYGFTRQGEESGRDGDLQNWDSFSIEVSDLPDFGLNNQDAIQNSRSQWQGNNWSRAGELIDISAKSPDPLPPPASVDGLAWYLPYHYYGNLWGIYVKEVEVLNIAGKIKKILGGPPSDAQESAELTRISLSVLYLHEAFHHKVESFATRLEIARLSPVYIPYNNRVYQTLSGTSSQLEEAIACGEMVRRLSEKSFHASVRPEIRRATTQMLRAWIPTLPPSYNRGLEFVGGTSYGELLSQIASADLHPSQPNGDWDIASQMTRGIFNKNTVVHVLVPRGTTPLIPWFNKELALSVSTREIEKILRKFGYDEVPGS